MELFTMGVGNYSEKISERLLGLLLAGIMMVSNLL